MSNVKRIGEISQTENSRNNMAVLIQTLKDYPQERIEHDIFTLNQVVKQSAVKGARVKP
jgi:hypothetical protein